MLLTAPVSPQSLRRNTFVHAPPCHSKMAADRACKLVFVSVYLSTTLNTRVQARKQPVMPETRILRYSLEQRDGACLRPMIDPLCFHALSLSKPFHAQRCGTDLSAIPALNHQRTSDKLTLANITHSVSKLFRILNKHTHPDVRQSGTHAQYFLKKSLSQQ